MGPRVLACSGLVRLLCGMRCAPVRVLRNCARGLQAEAAERKEGGLQEVALLTIELEELREGNFEARHQEATTQVRERCGMRLISSCWLQSRGCCCSSTRGTPHALLSMLPARFGVMLQVEKLQKELKMKTERVETVEEQMAKLREELNSKSKSLDSARSELSQLKQQVQDQLKELQASSACQPQDASASAVL